jgi:hypothetical protein
MLSVATFSVARVVLILCWRREEEGGGVYSGGWVL